MKLSTEQLRPHIARAAKTSFPGQWELHSPKVWKRTKKAKDASSNWVRIFVSGTYEAAVVTDPTDTAIQSIKVEKAGVPQYVLPEKKQPVGKLKRKYDTLTKEEVRKLLLEAGCESPHKFVEFCKEGGSEGDGYFDEDEPELPPDEKPIAGYGRKLKMED